MVYPGHPSRGCETCRVRKVKCDEAKPICLRCTKANRLCLGYRVLDDGTPQKQSAIQKSHTDSKSSIPGINLALISSGSQTSIVSGEVPDAYVSPLLDSLSSFPRMSLNQVNLHRLFSHIAHLPQISGVYGGCLTCLPDVSETSPPSSPLYPALSALLLAFISRGNEAVGTLKDAGENYGHALRLTRHIILRKEATREKEVILTTLILSMYEDLVNSQQQPTSLNPHVRGAIALMKAQSVECHKDATMKRLYGAFATRVMYTSYRTSLHLSDDEFPLTISELRELHEAAPIAKAFTAARPDLQPAVCKLLEAHLLLREVQTRTMSEKDVVEALEGVIKSIDGVENEMSLWPQNLPADHTPEAVQLSPDAVDPWSSTSLVYLAFWVANAWAHYRSVRIFANDLLLWAYDLITPAVITEPTKLSFTELTIKIKVAHEQIQSSASGICASMPYHLGYSVRGSDERRYPKEGYPGGRYSRKMSACNIVWPLYAAGVVDGLNPSQKLWIARQLDFLSTHVGVKQASTLAMGIRSRVYENEKMACMLIGES